MSFQSTCPFNQNVPCQLGCSPGLRQGARRMQLLTDFVVAVEPYHCSSCKPSQEDEGIPRYGRGAASVTISISATCGGSCLGRRGRTAKLGVLTFGKKSPFKPCKCIQQNRILSYTRAHKHVGNVIQLQMKNGMHVEVFRTGLVKSRTARIPGTRKFF